MENSIPQKQCKTCGETKPLYHFHKNSASKDGLLIHCKECMTLKQGVKKRFKVAPPGYKYCNRCNELFPATEEHFRKSGKRLRAYCYPCEREVKIEYHKLNPHIHKKSQKKWDEKNPEKKKKITRESARKRRANKPLAELLYQRDYAQRNRDTINANKRHRHKVNPLREITNSHNYRARKANTDGAFTKQDIVDIFNNQEGRCAYCGIALYLNVKGDVDIEHIQPLSRGGTNWPTNLAVACEHCNESKGDRTIDEWQLIRGW